MDRYLLFYRDDNIGVNNYAWMVHWCRVFGVTPIVVDLDKATPRVLDRPPYNFRTLDQALAYPGFKDLTWIWCDYNAKFHWNEVVLQKEDVIYCIGHDDSGFQGYVGENRVKAVLPTGENIDEGGEFNASIIATMLLYEVYT